MNYKEYTASLANDNPPEGLNDLLISLWYERKGDWHRSHEIAQSIGGKDAAWIHAYLHRVEGDTGNAGYWYSMAGRQMPDDKTLEEEWKEIVMELLDAAD